MNTKNYIFFVFAALLLCSCSTTKYLKEGEYLLNKTKIKYENPKAITNKKELREELTAIVKPQPNSGFFKLRLKFYNWMGVPKKEGSIRDKIRNYIGEPPSLYDENEQRRNRLRMRQYLKDHGYFASDIEVDTTIRSKKITVTYEVKTRGQYRINQVFFPDDTTSIDSLARKYRQSSLLKKGDYYLEPRMSEERTRISNIAADQGYLDFNESYVYFFVDTLRDTLAADLYLKIEKPENGKPHLKYQLGKTRVFPNYNLSTNLKNANRDTIFEEPSFMVIEDRHVIDHDLLERMILQNEGDVFIKKSQEASVSHLLDLEIFKFVNLKYTRRADTTSAILDRNFFLTPDFNQNISGDLGLNNRTGRFFGTTATATYTHKNLFKKAIAFNGSLSGGLETQIGNPLGFINTLDLNVEVSLSTPRFILPFRQKEYSGKFVPRTQLSLSNNLQRRSGLFTINSTNLKFGYIWKENKRKQHSLFPLTVNRVEILNKTTAFDSLLNTNPRLIGSLRDQFIGGLDYTYTYTNQTGNPRKDYLFFKTDFKIAGNIFGLASNVFDASKNSDDEFTLFGLPYSQFVSVEPDFRFYKKFGLNTLASRISPGVGIAYGNSKLLPYTEQFFVGGANSIRAFRIRTLGPGNSKPDVSDETAVGQQFIDRTGDLKLELSTEYRFGIFSFLKGAVFMDAGNVWLINDDIPGGQFRFQNFWREIAVGGGFGLRLDFDYFVLRLDTAIPLRKPFENEGFQETINQIDFGSSVWRQQNLIYNLAVGYPF